MVQVLNSHSKGGARDVLKPRKAPRQARSIATVDAILEAAVQVLLQYGMRKLTTTRVAARAGVSIGSMYQYYSNKQALLYAVLQRHLEAIVGAITTACVSLHQKPLEEISDGIVQAYLDAKISNMNLSRAIYLISSEFDTADLLGNASRSAIDAMATCLGKATDASFTDLASVSFVMRATLAGSVRAVLERGPAAEMLATLRNELPLVCRSYLRSRASA